jgi:hypothetical protein
MVEGEEPGNRLDQRSIDSPANVKWTATGENSSADCASPLPEHGEENTNDEPPPHIQLLRATAFVQVLASEEVVEAFVIQLGECQGLLGASLEGITEGEGNPRMLNARAGAAAVVAAEE